MSQFSAWLTSSTLKQWIGAKVGDVCCNCKVFRTSELTRILLERNFVSLSIYSNIIKQYLLCRLMQLVLATRNSDFTESIAMSSEHKQGGVDVLQGKMCDHNIRAQTCILFVVLIFWFNVLFLLLWFFQSLSWSFDGFTELLEYNKVLDLKNTTFLRPSFSPKNRLNTSYRKVDTAWF